MGGWTWTSKNGKWVNVIDDVAMGEDMKQCGLFLRLLFNSDLKSSTKLNQIK
ncbi:hypothetical protein METHB2_40064 [Candidatus Methylobacter favarea]|uniref:Uncharacterized protein n=1 Tax=Candidatus Methylobacter favarea TaxID=2707345 RepID=A0A8S0XT74_9GAMM|nr:hypothetical protein [Candidatus Methylobacter favarea]CAA9891364.1 hypothetical protein METHB2_40064 [Candidatus Methylobacter favarea]